MRSSRLLTSAVVVLFVALVAVWLAPRVTAQSEARKAQKWEYCAITRVVPWTTEEGKSIMTALVHHFRTSGLEEEEIDFEVRFTDVKKELHENEAADQKAVETSAARRAKAGALAKAVAKLGDEGWEMIGVPEVSQVLALPYYPRTICFKRPK